MTPCAELTRRYGAALVIDETHTISTGPGGYTRAYGLDPDFFVLGKSIAGGIPVAVWGTTQEMAAADLVCPAALPAGPGNQPLRLRGHSGRQRPPDQSHPRDVGQGHDRRQLRSHVRSGGEDGTGHRRDPAEARAALARDPHRREGGVPVPAAHAPQRRRGPSGRHALLEAFIHLYLLNRGVLLTPFHNMALMCPFTSAADVDLHDRLLDECIGE